MRFLGLGLVAEGPTDYRFFKPLIRRCVLTLCEERGKIPIEIGEAISVEPRLDAQDGNRTTRVTKALLAAARGLDIVFLHADGGGDADRTREQVLKPLTDAMAADARLANRKPVRIVPVREMEAWPLADGYALRRVLGVNLSDEALGLPAKPQLVEKVTDPKKLLRDIAERARGGRGRRRQGISLDQLGEFVDLGRMKLVPAFQAFHAELESVLGELGILKS